MFVYIHTYACMYACMCVYAYACVYVYMHTCIHTYAYMSQGRAPPPSPPLWLVSGRVLSAAEIRQRPRLVGGQGSSTPAPPPVGLWACGPVAPLVRAICTHRGSRLVTSPVEARHVTGRGLVSPSPPVLGFRFRLYVLGLGFLV